MDPCTLPSSFPGMIFYGQNIIFRCIWCCKTFTLMGTWGGLFAGADGRGDLSFPAAPHRACWTRAVVCVNLLTCTSCLVPLRFASELFSSNLLLLVVFPLAVRVTSLQQISVQPSCSF